MTSTADSQLKWRKRKRDSNPKRQQKSPDDDEEDDEGDTAGAQDDDAENYKDSRTTKRSTDIAFDQKQSEVLSDDGRRICDFPVVFRRTVNRPHNTVVSIVVAERLQSSGSSSLGGASNIPFLENISHGQFHALSSVPPDHPSLQPSDVEKPSSYVCTPPALMEGKGIMKRLGNDQILLVPMHSDWFSSSSAHRLERQVIPHFFNGKSAEHTPQKYMDLRNKIIFKYMESPGRRLSFADCQGLVPTSELYDLSRIVRFLDHWGIINYLSASSVHRGLRMAGSLLREDANGELIIQISPLRSIDSLILFDRPKCSLKSDELSFMLNSSSSKNSVSCWSDLDIQIRERLSEHCCNFCFKQLPNLFYQSLKEVETILCSECFNEAKFITGHSSLDFVRMESKKEFTDVDGETWTDQETLLLLEAIEKYNDNWNEIAEHVATKSKAQCILYFIRLPMEDRILENIDVPRADVSPILSELQTSRYLANYENCATTSELDWGEQLPFVTSPNAVMSLVAFLASAIGPRVAAACANAALAVLTKENSSSEKAAALVGFQGANCVNSVHQNDEYALDQAINLRDSNSLSGEHVRYAAYCGLSSAAMKAKLFADQEEREVQRLAAIIINHQLKRLELKLKQFAEVETLLLKECEQVERTRQRLSAERVRIMSSYFSPQGTSALTMLGIQPTGSFVPSLGNLNIRPAVMLPTFNGPASLAPYGDSMHHPQSQFMQRQQTFSFGPRLPLSALHSSSGSSLNAMFNPSMTNTNAHNPLFRSSSSGNNSNID